MVATGAERRRIQARAKKMVLERQKLSHPRRSAAEVLNLLRNRPRQDSLTARRPTHDDRQQARDELLDIWSEIQAGERTEELDLSLLRRERVAAFRLTLGR